MDLVYMPEVLTYGSIRAPVYRDYEQPWNQDYSNYGKSSSIYCARQMPKATAQSKHNCPLCKESKRRSLGAYIRGKSRLNSCSEISEEEEEEDEPSSDNKTSQTAEKKETDSTTVCETKK